MSGFSGLVVAGSLTIAGSTTDLSAYTTVDINTSFTLSSGTFSAPSGDMTIARVITITGGTFNNSGGTLIFDGNTSDTLSCNNVVFNLVVFNHTAGAKTVGSNCNMPLGNNPTVPKNLTLSGTLTGTGTLTMGAGVAFNINSTGTLSGFTGLASQSGTIAGATLDFSSYTTFSWASSLVINGSANITFPNNADLNGSFTLSSPATLNAPSGDLLIAGSMTLSSGSTLNANGGRIIFDGNFASSTLTCNNTVFGSVKFEHVTTNIKTIQSDCNLPLGADPIVTGRLTNNGMLTGTGILTLQSASGSSFGSTGLLSGFDGLISAGSVTTSSTNLDLSGYVPVDIDGGLFMSAGSFTAPDYMTLQGSITFTGGTFNHNNGTIEFDGGVSSTFSCNNAVFNLVIFNNTATKALTNGCNMPLGADPIVGPISLSASSLTGTGALSANSNITLFTDGTITGFDTLSVDRMLTINGANADLSTMSSVTVESTFWLASGTFNAPSILYIKKGFMANGGTLNPGSGIVDFTGPSSGVIHCGVATFNVVRFSHTGGKKTANQTCNIPLGNDPILGLGGDIQIAGTITGTGTAYMPQGSELTFIGDGTATGFDSLEVGTLMLESTLLTNFSAIGSIVVEEDLLLVNGSLFGSPTSTLEIKGNLRKLNNDGYLYTQGLFAEGVSVSDSSALSVTGDIDIRLDIDMDDWQEGSTQSQGLLSKYDSNTSNRSYQLTLRQGGYLEFDASSNGTSSSYYALSTDTVDDLAGRYWVRVTRSSLTGVVLFYTSADGVSWTQLGDPIATTSGSIFDGNSTLNIGEKTTAVSPASAKFYRAQVRNNLLDNGTGIVFDADFRNLANGTLSFSESSSNAATVSVYGSYAAILNDAGGDFNHNDGTVELTGVDQEIQGDFSFFNLTKSVDSPSTLVLWSGNTIGISGDLMLSGDDESNMITLASNALGSQANINAVGSSTLEFISIKDINSLTELSACSATDLGGNNNISFNSSDCDEPSDEEEYSDEEENDEGVIEDEEEQVDAEEIGPGEAVKELAKDIVGGVNNNIFRRWYVRWTIVVGCLVIAGTGSWWLVSALRRKDDEDQNIYPPVLK